LLSIPDFNNEPLEIRLRYWHKKDLTPIRFLVQSAQQEVGWSDFEVALLLRRYANTLLPEPMQVPFLASYWQQAGYQVQLVSDQERLSLFYRVPTAVVAWPMVRHLNRNWVTLEADIQSDVSLPANMMLTGQALRFSSLNDRAFSTTFRSVVYRFNTGENEENIQFELPVYWSRIKRSPLPHLEQYRTQLPNYLWEQMALVHTAETISGKAVRFAQWLKSDFEVTDEDLSIQQSLLLKKQNRETMFVLLAAWWSFLSSQPAALVVDNEQHYLALRLKEGIQVDSAVENRGHRWWLWTTSLNTAQPSLNTAKWRYLP
jgi:hypothetical protein